MLSIGLSKQYNLKHYFGWAGLGCDNKLTVVLNHSAGARPVIMLTAEAEKLMEKEAKAK